MTVTVAAIGSCRRWLAFAACGLGLPLSAQLSAQQTPLQPPHQSPQQWQQAIPSSQIAQLVHDVGRNRTSLLQPSSNPFASEVWDFVGDRWRQSTATATAPVLGACAYDLFR